MSLADQIGMLPDERQSLEDGYARSGHPGSLDDFLIDQAALYQHTSESDPRHRTFFYGTSLKNLLGNPQTAALINARVQAQGGDKTSASMTGLQQAMGR